MAKDNTELSYQQRILRVLSYIKQNLDEPLDLSQLASIAYFSPYHFHRIFSELVGESVKNHVRRLKLQRAMIRLATTQDSITNIALDSGFNSLEAFSRAIKVRYDRTPTQVRQSMQQEFQRIMDSEQGQLEVKTLHLDSFDLAFVRHIGDYQQAGKAWLKLIELTKAKYVLPKERLRIGFAYDHPVITPADKCCYDACISWQDEFVEAGELGRMQIDPGKYVMFEHRGSLATIHETYRLFAKQWVMMQKKVFSSRHNFMWYKNIALLTNPKRQITECYFPVEQ